MDQKDHSSSNAEDRLGKRGHSLDGYLATVTKTIGARLGTWDEMRLDRRTTWGNRS